MTKCWSDGPMARLMLLILVGTADAVAEEASAVDAAVAQEVLAEVVVTYPRAALLETK